MAFQAQPTPLPPTTIHSSTRLTPSDAHAFLTAYLNRAAADPSYQPDSTLSAHGPVSANTTGAPNLVIHSLKRVQAGMAGEVLGRDVVMEQQLQEAGEGITDGEDWSGERRKRGRKSSDAAAGGKQDVGWQDLETFEREQVDLVEGGDVEDQEDIVTVVDEVEPAISQPTIDKEERKRKKKERRKAEQKARAAAAS